MSYVCRRRSNQCDDADKMRQCLRICEDFCVEMKVEANVKKCAIMTYSHYRLNTNEIFQWRGKDIPKNKHYKYLGVYIEQHGSWTIQSKELIMRTADYIKYCMTETFPFVLKWTSFTP